MENSIEHIQSLVESNKLEEAETQARKLLSKKQDSLEIKITLARILAMEEKDIEAIDLLKNIVEQDKENYYPLYLLAIIKDNQEEFDDAIEYYKQALKLKPNSGRIFYQLGKIYNNHTYKGKNEYSALYNLRNAITSENPPAGAFLELASIEPQSRSIYILQKGLEKYPSDLDLNIRLCERLYSLEEYKKCIQVIDEADGKQLKSEILMCYKALSLYHLKQFREASHATKQIVADENYRDFHIEAFCGILLFEAQDFFEAEKILKKAIANDIMNSLDFRGHVLLICCYLRDSKIEDAEKTFREIPETIDFSSPIYLFMNSEIFGIDTYFLEVVNTLISKGSVSSNKARFFKAVHLYSPEKNKGKLSSEDLVQIRKEFLGAVGLFGQSNPYIHRLLYHVSADQKNWGDAVYYYFLSEIYEAGDEVYGWEFDVVLEAINRSQKNIEKLFATIDRVLGEATYLSDQFAKKCLSQLITFFYTIQVNIDCLTMRR